MECAACVVMYLMQCAKNKSLGLNFYLNGYLTNYQFLKILSYIDKLNYIMVFYNIKKEKYNSFRTELEDRL